MELLPHFVPQSDGAEDVSEEGPFFLYAGRLEKLKGVQELIALFAGFRAAKLLIVGEGTYGPELRQQAGGMDHVKFLGKVHPQTLSGLYRRAVAVLVPSLCYETFGLTAAEALAHGTPAIVRRIGALSEIVEQTGGGMTFETLDECRAAMRRLLDDSRLRTDMGQRGRSEAARRWSPEAHLEQYLGVIERVKASKRGPVATRPEPEAVGVG
jgi:glycosyltransferase involved in cell wall biosynthesis